MNSHTPLLYALGAILLGAVGICFHDFAMQWQPVPAGIGMRTQLAYLAARCWPSGGALLLVPRLERAGALLLTVFIGLWMLVLNLPAAIASASHIGAWNSPAEITFMATGALALFASGVAGNARPKMLLVARVLAGISAMVFGFAHFNYIDFTASMVPGWIPLQDILGLGHRRRAPRGRPGAGERRPGQARRRLRSGDDGLVRGAACTCRGSSPRRTATSNGSCWACPACSPAPRCS